MYVLLKHNIQLERENLRLQTNASRDTLNSIKTPANYSDRGEGS